MDKNTKIIIRNIINNENLYTITHKSKYKLKEIQKKYELLRHDINAESSKDKINQELIELLEKQSEYFATRTDEIVTFVVNYLKNNKL